MSVLVKTGVLFKNPIWRFVRLPAGRWCFYTLFFKTEVRTLRCQLLRHVTVNWPVLCVYPDKIRYWNYRNKPTDRRLSNCHWTVHRTCPAYFLPVVKALCFHELIFMSGKRLGFVDLSHRKLEDNTIVAWSAVTPPSVVAGSTQLSEGCLHGWAGEAAKILEDCGSLRDVQ
jgi:hypothetical protein